MPPSGTGGQSFVAGGGNVVMAVAGAVQELGGGGAAGPGQPDHESGSGGANTPQSGAGGTLEIAGGSPSQGGGAGASSGGAPSQGASAGASSGGTIGLPTGCRAASPVSFNADVAPILAKSCGKSGCHVTDNNSTKGALCPDGRKQCGFTHAYDWITAGVHNEFCKQTPAPIRYSVIMDVLGGPNPASCTKTRVMPPDEPLSECDTAIIGAWLAEPKVTQLHRADDTSPTEPYPMPPFN